MNGDYIIIGDTKRFKDCLVFVARTYENAEKILNRMLNDPTESDKRLIQGHTNLRIDFAEAKDCWWNENWD